MNKIKSIGLIETLGMVGAVEAADAAVKAANVRLLGYELNGAGYVVIKLTGDVAAVQAAVSSGAATAKRLGNLMATHVIARPDDQVVDREIKSPDNVPPFSAPKEKPVSEPSSHFVPEQKPEQPGRAKPAGEKPASGSKVSGKPLSPGKKKAGTKQSGTAKPKPKK